MSFDNCDGDAIATASRPVTTWNDPPAVRPKDNAVQTPRPKIWKLGRNYLLFAVIVSWIVVFWPLLAYGLWKLFD